jgi:hypothetical protein
VLDSEHLQLSLAIGWRVTLVLLEKEAVLFARWKPMVIGLRWPWRVGAWCRGFDCTEYKLYEAVGQVGNLPEEVSGTSATMTDKT